MGLILGIGAAVLAATLAVPQFLIWQNRYKSDREVLRERMEKQYAEDLASMRAHAKTDDDRALIEFGARTHGSAAYQEAISSIRVSDGIDQFEAWLLAGMYFGENFGVCGVVRLPKLEGSRWRVPFGAGFPPRRGLLFIDCKSGRITCEGHPSVDDPVAYLKARDEAWKATQRQK